MPRKPETITRLRDELCHYCGKARGATLDHIVPALYGGVYRLWNLVPACQKCNHDKGADWPTCPCEKCRAAVARHIGDPVFRMKTLKVLDGKEQALVKNSRLLRAKADKFERDVEAFKEYRSSIEAHLTDHTFTDRMDT